MRRTFIALAVAAAAAAAPAVAAADVTLPAGVVQTGPTSFRGPLSPCSSVTAIDGYLFACLPYYNGTDASAVGLWWELEAQPGYQPGAPIYSISAQQTVSGTVGPTPDTYGTG